MTYTRHGHHIPGTLKDDEQGQIPKARCGGVSLCIDCQKDKAKYFEPDIPEIIPEQAFEDTSEYDKDPDRFLKAAKHFVTTVYNHRIDDEEFRLTGEDLYIVWFTKTLGNWKALISTSKPGDGLYFEVTHNGEKAETYVDTYMKLRNDTFSE